MDNLIDLIKIEKFNFISLPGDNPCSKYIEHYNSAFDCWRNVWEETYKDLGFKKDIYSDEFTRQGKINCIFYDTRCVAIMFLRWADLSVNTTRNDSYFRLWSDDDIRDLAKDGNNIVVMSNMTIAKEWRKDVCNISMKDLIVYFCSRNFVESNASTMATFTRNTKNVHKLAERFGGICIRENIVNYNSTDLVNLFAFRKYTASEGTNLTVKELGRMLWEKRIIVPRSSEEIPSNNPTQKGA